MTTPPTIDPATLEVLARARLRPEELALFQTLDTSQGLTGTVAALAAEEDAFEAKRDAIRSLRRKLERALWPCQP